MPHRLHSLAAPALVLLFLFSGGVSFAAGSLIGPEPLAVSPDGKRLYVLNPNQRAVAIVDTGTFQPAESIPLGTQPLYLASLAVSRDGTHLYATDGRESLLVLSVSAGRVVARIPVGKFPAGVAVSPDGQRVYVANNQSDTVSVVDSVTYRVVATIPVGVNPTGLAVSPDGQRVFVANTGRAPGGSDARPGTVTVIAAATQQVLATVPVRGQPRSLAVSPDGRRVYVSHINRGSERVDVIVDSVLGYVRQVTTPPIPGGDSLDLAVSPDGTRLYLIPAEWAIVVSVDPKQPRVTGAVAPREAPLALAVSPDGKRLYVSHWGNQSLAAIDTASFQVVATVKFAPSAH